MRWSDLNLGCPLTSARDGHYGAYLLGQKDWPLVENIVSGLTHALPVPISTKIRLCNPVKHTLPFAERLVLAGSSWIALHARSGASTRKRRHGPANLSQVKLLKECLQVPVISNGNVRTYGDVLQNLEFTRADGVMVGETLLGNPCLFAGATPDPVQISLEYLEICKQCPEGSVDLEAAKKHVKHFVDFQCSRRTWISKFIRALTACRTIEEVDKLLRVKTQRWRGKSPLPRDAVDVEEDSEGEKISGDGYDDLALLV
ncbi:FMN-linked oxidoreductase [Thelephora ganbajun]|uniref:FMN-linked oxidoreductase n=1 Tax=Thelephora ganbajun TaxID=370292 RepID=A0ACB6ZG81_THEGA|nr:FMN-linked oxidoreductase [Thelephora ganbajun]